MINSDINSGNRYQFDLVVDPYTQASCGKIRIVVNAYFDGKPRRNDSFVAFEMA